MMYPVRVAVVPMKDLGMRQKATMDEARKVYREHGYRPLTVEEAIELRLQFLEQADLPFTDRMHGFSVLMESDADFFLTLCRHIRSRVSVAHLLSKHLTLYDHEKEAMRAVQFDPAAGYHFHISEDYTPPEGTYRGTQFACAIIETE